MIFSNTELVFTHEENSTTISDIDRIVKCTVKSIISEKDLMEYSLTIPSNPAAKDLYCNPQPKITKNKEVSLILSPISRDAQLKQIGEVYMLGKKSDARKTAFFFAPNGDMYRKVCIVSHAEPTDTYCVFWTNGDPETYYYVTDDRRILVYDRSQYKSRSNKSRFSKRIWNKLSILNSCLHCKTLLVPLPIKRSKLLNLPFHGWKKIA